MIICASDYELEIGKVYNWIIVDGDFNDHKQPFKVISKATYEEFLIFCKEMGTDLSKEYDRSNELFYKLSVD